MTFGDTLIRRHLRGNTRIVPFTISQDHCTDQSLPSTSPATTTSPPSQFFQLCPNSAPACPPPVPPANCTPAAMKTPYSHAQAAVTARAWSANQHGTRNRHTRRIKRLCPSSGGRMKKHPRLRWLRLGRIVHSAIARFRRMGDVII